MADIKLLKMITGEELLAEVTFQTTDGTLLVKNATKIVLMPPRNPSQDRSPSIGLAPWIEFAENDTFYLDKSKVLAIMDPIPQFVQEFKRFHSKLITPPIQKIIVPEN